MYTLTVTRTFGGPDLNDVDAAMKVLDFEGGCDSSGSTDGRVFIMSRLGVLCGLDYNFTEDYHTSNAVLAPPTCSWMRIPNNLYAFGEKIAALRDPVKSMWKKSF